MLFAGVISKHGGKATVTPLLSTTKTGSVWIPPDITSLNMPDPVKIRQQVRDGTEAVMLACLISGDIATNFPDGIDVEDDSEDKDEDKKPPTTQPKDKTKRIESIKEAASHRQDVRLALEFQPHEPHARMMLSNVGILLHVLDEVALNNVGANLDIGHSFAALETPAESVALLARKGKLFYLHTNDNTGDGGDWDMISGSIHFWHWLVLLLVLDRVGVECWLGAVINTKDMGPVQAGKCAQKYPQTQQA